MLGVGSELTTGSTRDTNSGELAAELSGLGIDVLSISTLPDRLPALSDALATAVATAGIVITTGGLGPTPDDLTREAIAAACGVDTFVDVDLLGTLRDLFERRGLTMPAANIKQAWLIPGAISLRNPNGSAPGWWVDRPDGKVVIALPGPPREMRPMWRDHVVPLLRGRGAGTTRASHTLRLTGIGESAVVDLVGDDVMRATSPEVATYARADAVDLQISASGDGAAGLVGGMVDQLTPLLEPYLFARGSETWLDALDRRIAGRALAVIEIGTAGQLGALLGPAKWLLFAETLAPGGALANAHRDLRILASHVRQLGGSDIGLAVRAHERRRDTAVTIAIDLGDGAAVNQVTRTAFLAGDEGRRRAGITAAAELWRLLGQRRTDPADGAS